MARAAFRFLNMSKYYETFYKSFRSMISQVNFLFVSSGYSRSSNHLATLILLKVNTDDRNAPLTYSMLEQKPSAL